MSNFGNAARTVCFGRALMVSTATLIGCGVASDDEVTGKSAEAVGSSIFISGEIVNATGLGLPGVTVSLGGSSTATQTTGSHGGYSFGPLAAGTYSITPTSPKGGGCVFSPNFVNLGKLASNTTQVFTGSGATCVGTTGAAITLSDQLGTSFTMPVSTYTVSYDGTHQVLSFTKPVDNTTALFSSALSKGKTFVTAQLIVPSRVLSTFQTSRPSSQTFSGAAKQTETDTLTQ